MYITGVITHDEKVFHMLHYILTNIGSNYDYTSCGVQSHSLELTYILNVYNNTAILFQKVKTHSSIVLYVRLMTLVRSELDVTSVKDIIHIFQASKPIYSHGIENAKSDFFISYINQ